jgi:hypothetical protein
MKLASTKSSNQQKHLRNHSAKQWKIAALKLFKIQILIKKGGLKYLIQRISSLHWKSHYPSKLMLGLREKGISGKEICCLIEKPFTNSKWWNGTAVPVVPAPMAYKSKKHVSATQVFATQWRRAIPMKVVPVNTGTTAHIFFYKTLVLVSKRFQTRPITVISKSFRKTNLLVS